MGFRKVNPLDGRVTTKPWATSRLDSEAPARSSALALLNDLCVHRESAAKAADLHREVLPRGISHSRWQSCHQLGPMYAIIKQ